MTDFSFISGQVRAQESKLLNVNRLDRMIGAKNAEEAFTVLTELQYAEYFEEGSTAKDSDAFVQRGLWETKKMIVEGTCDDELLKILWYQFDINNLKRILKIKFKEGAETCEDFSQENGISRLGTLSEKDLTDIVFKGETRSDFPEEFLAAVNQTESVLEQKEYFKFVEYALDKAYFEVVKGIVAKHNNIFFSEVVSILIDQTNIKNIARSIFTLKTELDSEAFIEGGDLIYTQVKELNNPDVFVKWFESSQYADSAKDLSAEGSTMIAVERRLSDYYHNFMIKSVIGEVASPIIPYVYFEKRLQNARQIKLVMLCKFNGIAADKIYEMLKHF